MKVGVIGAGTMGQGIAKAFAQKDMKQLFATSSRNGLMAEKRKSQKDMQDWQKKEK